MESRIIHKIILKSEGEQFFFGKKESQKLFSLACFDFKKDLFLQIFKNMNLFLDLFILFFLGIFRKIFRKNPAITEYMLVKRVINLKNKKIKFKELELIFERGKSLRFNLENFHLSNILGDIQGIIVKDQYNLSRLDLSNKIILDCGAHHGVFSLYCSLLGARQVYSFEPVSSTFNILKKNILLNKISKKIIPLNLAVGNKNSKEKIYFGKVADGSASLNVKFNRFEIINLIKLDDFVSKNKIKKVDLIKMDVEGNEEEALKGMNKLIKQHKPILTFSAYHKPSDKVILPKLVREIRKDYKIKLLNKFEEDFYCE